MTRVLDHHRALTLALATFLLACGSDDSTSGGDAGLDGSETGEPVTSTGEESTTSDDASTSSATLATESGDSGTTSGTSGDTSTGLDETGSDPAVHFWCALESGEVVAFDRLADTWWSDPVTEALAEVVAGNGLLLAGYYDALWVRSDGEWVGEAPTVDCSKMAFGGGIFVRMLYLRVDASTDGITWEEGDYEAIGRPAFGEGRFVGAGVSGMHWSVDGTSWTEVVLDGPSLHTGFATAYGDGRFVTVGDHGQTLYSMDGGESWVSNTVLAGEPILNGVTYGAGLFVAAGLEGALWTSPDGATWTEEPPIVSPTAEVTGLAFNEEIGEFLLTADDRGVAVTLASSDGKTWTDVDFDPGAGAVCASLSVAEPGTRG